MALFEPERKKARLEKTNAEFNRLKTAVPQAVLADEYTRDFQTVQVYAAEIKDKTRTSELIRILNDKYPLTDLGHLKRVRCLKTGKDTVLQIILHLKEDKSIDLLSSSNEIFLEQNEITKASFGRPFVVDVAKNPPLTREQFNQASKLWPVNFHEDKYVSRALRGELFDEDELVLITKFMRMALTAAEKTNSGKFHVGAVIVDPQRNHPIAVCHDLRCAGHPLQHAVMVCLDLVAHSQSSGAWQLDHVEKNGTWTLKNIDSQLQQGAYTIAGNGHVMDSRSSETGHFLDVKSSDCSQTCNLSNDTGDKCKTGPYLCTGYDLYVTREPCAMCAMALVHSRIRRVFYGCADSITGALGSRYKIHTQAGLNHHFEVFRGVLEEECRTVFLRSPSERI
ncbi:putative inactive tRNA-specific adenosine deaminase-like protein 3 isoform X2 [Oculina patagonica]